METLNQLQQQIPNDQANILNHIVHIYLILALQLKAVTYKSLFAIKSTASGG